ncbi:MAG: TetR family transcriptional regulator [Streptosporangiales bacterium]|nr:TetR family transcriptional regulator [Streptosporangiales bacterium]
MAAEMDAAPELGLRERKKRQTRQRIVAEAVELFAEHGFDKVPVAEIARRAEVSEATVFNYFATKEDIFYQGMHAFEQAIVDAVRDRPPGTPISTAFGDLVLRQRGYLAEGEAGVRRIATAARVIAGSPALQDRRRRTDEHFIRELAAVITEETSAGPGDLRPYVVANALMGVSLAMRDRVHAAALAGEGGASIADEVLAKGREALDLLERGIASLDAGSSGDE